MENLALILSSSFLAALLTKSADYLIQKFNYKKEYHKLILNKRLQAYEQLDQLMQVLTATVEDGVSIYPRAYSNQEENRKFTFLLHQAVNSRLWYSKKTAETILGLMELVAYSYEEKLKIDTANVDLKQLGIEINSDLWSFVEVLDSLMVEDLKSLHDIKKFFSEK